MIGAGRVTRVVDQLWFPNAPGERLAMLRILVGSYATIFLVVRLIHLTSYATWDPSHFAPIGVVSILTTPLPAGLVYTLGVATLVFSVAFTVGYEYRYTAPVFALLLLWVLTYSNSWRFILHTENMLVLHVGILACAPATDAWSWDARRKDAKPHGRKYGWAIRLMCVVCVLAYFIAGVAKVRYSGWDFVSGDMLRNHVAFGSVRKIELGSEYSPIGVWLLGFPALFTTLAALSLGLELLAPLALFHARFGRVWSLLMWGFHMGVLAIMLIGFVYPISLIAFAPFFRVEKLMKTKVAKKILRICTV